MNDTLLESKRVTVLDLLDRLLETGVVVDGQVDLSVADIDLVHLGLKMVLASSATLEQHNNGTIAHLVDPPDDPPEDSLQEPHADTQLPPTAPTVEGSGLPAAPAAQAGFRVRGNCSEPPAPSPERPGDRKINFEPAKVEQGLATLVLTLVELIRRLMEKQAIRKMEGGRLSDAQLERLGEAFRRLEEKMVELKRVFGLEDEDLNLDLGPLGELM